MRQGLGFGLNQTKVHLRAAFRVTSGRAGRDDYKAALFGATEKTNSGGGGAGHAGSPA